MPLQPVIRRSLAVLVEHPGLPDRLSIVESPFEDDVAEPLHQRAVRITLAIGKRVVLSVTGDPLLGDDCRGEPQPQTHRKSGEVVQFYTAMRLSAMQKQGDRNVGEVSCYNHKQNRLPPRRCPAAKIRHYLLR